MVLFYLFFVLDPGRKKDRFLFYFHFLWLGFERGIRGMCALNALHRDALMTIDHSVAYIS